MVRTKVKATAIMLWLAAGAMSPAAGAEPPEVDRIWHDVTLELAGALPNTHERLADDLELYLGRSRFAPDAEDARWRKYVLGYSTFFEARSTGDWHKDVKADRRYNWMDDEGTLTRVEDDGGTIRLGVDLAVHPDPWIGGGKATLDIRLERSGAKLTGRYTGRFVRAEADAAGPAGTHEISGKVTGRIREKPWPSRIEGHTPLAAGEHPRLLFRKADLPALRKRMSTPEGKAIVARLQRMLDRERMHLWDAYGYGLMYQLTGEGKWAQRAREHAKQAIAGKIPAGRYGWYTRDGGYMRVGPSVAAVAAEYDMCYDAWDADFRRWVAEKIQQRIWPNLVLEYDLSESDGQLNPRSNHYMLWNGGAGMSILAIRGDPGTDREAITRSHRIFLRRLKRGLECGFGDHGWFYEGTFCGRFPTNGALTQYLQALKVAEGKDFVAHCSEARWLITKWLFQAVRSGGKVRYHPRGMYDRFKWDHWTGDFAMGFAVAPAKHRPAILWFYRKVIEPDGVRRYDVGGVKEAAYAFVNWPLDLEPRDPADVLGHVLHDREGGFWALRSGWGGEGDVVATMSYDTVVMGVGLEKRFPFAIPPAARVTHVGKGDDGTVIVSAVSDRGMRGTKGTYHFAADFSGLCGARALLAGGVQRRSESPGSKRLDDVDEKQREKLPPFLRKAGRKAGKAPEPAADEPTAATSTVDLGGLRLRVMTVGQGPAPAVKTTGRGADRRAVIGQRTIRFDGKTLVLGRAEP